jgi:spore maturation protein CgeB
MLGAKKTEYLIPGYNEQHHFKIIPSVEQLKKYKSDVFFMGSPYNDNWGYKRALFLSKFCSFRFLFLGPECWKEWFIQFPELEPKWTRKEGYLPDEELNLMMNCTKIIPVDANPGIINGCHIRVFDAIAAGALPLIEYRKDLDIIFKDTGIPLIKSYDEIPGIVRDLIDNDNERNIVVRRLQANVLKNYNIHRASDIIFAALKL